MPNKHIQLYSLKDEAKADFIGTLRKLKAIGYEGVEFFGGYYGGYSAKELRKILDDIGLLPVSAHVSTDEVSKHVEFAKELELQYLVDPWADIKDHASALAFSARLNDAGEVCKEHGIKFGYHNHAHEFLRGLDGHLLETLLLYTDPKLVCFELDVGWAKYADATPAWYIKHHPGRFKLLHIKECGHVFGPSPSEEDFQKYPGMQGNKWNVKMGSGLVHWSSVFSAALDVGIDCFIVEREHDYLGDMFRCVEEDLDALRGFLGEK